ncbi:MAG: hypothetical protein O9264_17280 [Leptospira sp.]|nr:hypothetical protein [Leptospira sp.]
MKRNFIKLTSIAMMSTLALTACKPDKVKSEPLLGLALASSIRSAASGNCAISVNATGLYYGNLETVAINSQNAAGLAAAYADFITHYNSTNGTSVTGTTIFAEPYNRKYDTFYTDSSSWTAAKRAALISAIETATASNATFIALKAARGTGILACGRIPRSQCALTGLGTATRALDLTNQISAVNTVLTNTACRRPDVGTTAAIKEAGIRGFIGDVTFADGTFTSSARNGSNANFSSADGNTAAGFPNYTHIAGNTILAERAYPKIGALVSLGFGVLMPVSTGTTSYALSTSEYTRGSNIAFTVVDSCEGLGLGSNGFTTNNATVPLMSTKEITYAFSTNGAAAGYYAEARGALFTSNGKPAPGVANTTAADIQKVEDAVACNRSLRAATSLPLAIGGGKLDDINAVSGDGNGSATLVACVYGGTTTARTTLRTVLGTADDSGIPATLNGIQECPTAASTGAARFGDDGLQTLGNFPSN